MYFKKWRNNCCSTGRKGYYLKHDPSYPYNAVKFVLDQVDLKLSEIDKIVFFDKPFLKFERLLETYVAFAVSGFASLSQKQCHYGLKKSFFRKTFYSKQLRSHDENYKSDENIFFSDHHLSHAASAFYPSPFEEANNIDCRWSG